MAWTTLTKTDAAHDAGKPVTKDLLIDPVIDDLNYLFDEVALSAPAIKNGSFENGTVGANQTPSGWTWTAYTGGTRAISSTTGEQSHGQNGVKITHPSGGSNGGGYLTTDDFIPCTVKKLVYVAWEMKVSAANGAQNKVTIFWYQKDQTASAVTTSNVIYDDTAGTTSWTQCMSGAQPPSDATFFKIRVTGGDSATDPGSSTDIFFDNVRIVNGPADVFDNSAEYNAASASTYVKFIPNSTGFVWVEMWGSGSGGHGGGGIGGGGGGEYAAGYFQATAATSYPVTVGAGGTGGGSPTSGNPSNFNTTSVIANGGTSSATSAGGAGGTGGTGEILINGDAGGTHAAPFAMGGAGGGHGGAGGSSSIGGMSPTAPGGGGGGDGALEAGASGAVKIWY
jgi:hypothetical protein